MPDRVSPETAKGVEATPAELYRRYAPDLLRLLQGLLRDRTDAEDALQQVFLKYLDQSEAISRDGIKGWLFTVAYHEAMNVRRRQVRDARGLQELWGRPAWSQGPVGAEHALTEREDRDAIRQALRELPAEQREVVERRFYRHQKFAEIAAELGCPLGTVLTRMRLALQKLRPLVSEERDHEC